jgi:SAM-dependent methyltransferase
MTQAADGIEHGAPDSPFETRRFIDIPCLICGGEQVEIIASAADIEAQFQDLEQFHQRRRTGGRRADLADRAEFTQGYPTHVVECRACGFIFRNPRPASVTSAYVRDQYSESHLRSEFESQRKWAEKKSLILTDWLPVDRTPVVIEVGSFVGGFLAAGQRRGWIMLGVDPGKQVTEFCRTRRLPVYCGTLGDASIADGSVDAVVIWNTFDQLPDPDTTLAAARRILRRTGLLVVRVPNGSFYRKGVELMKGTTIWRNLVPTFFAWNNLLAFPYLHGYSLSSLDRLLARHDFRRRRVNPDTLLPLADQDTKTWARWEESLVKWACRVLVAQPLWDAHRLAPWLDLYYQRNEEMSYTSSTLARRLHSQHVIG